MAKSKYDAPQEVIATWEDAQAMMRDHTMIVVMALPTASAELFNVTFWSKEDGDLPPWLIDREAA